MRDLRVGEFDLSICLAGGEKEKRLGMRRIKAVDFLDRSSVEVIRFLIFTGSRGRRSGIAKRLSGQEGVAGLTGESNTLFVVR